MHSYLSASFYNLFSNICKIFGTSEKCLSFLSFSIFLSETHISIGICLCAHDFRADDWSPSKWQHFSLSATAKGRICVPILSNKPIKRTGVSVWKYILMEIAGRWIRERATAFHKCEEWSQTKENKTIGKMKTAISMWIM